MKNFRKTLSLLLAAVMLCGMAAFGSFTGFKAQAAVSPVLELKKVSENGNKVTVSVDIVSGNFNALDFNFVTTDNVTCNSISVQGGFNGVGNISNGYVSAVTTNIVSSGTIISAEFTLPSSGEYSISGNVTNCAVTTRDTDGQTINIDVHAVVTGSVTGGSQSGQIYAKAPMFKLEKISQNGNKVTAALNLISGSFYSMNLYFSPSAGTVCESVTFSDGFSGTPLSSNNMSFEIKHDGSTLGTVLTAVFTVPSDGGAYTISGYGLSCIVPAVDQSGQSVFCRINSVSLGSSLSGNPFDAYPAAKTENVSMNYKDVKKIAPASVPAGSKVEYKSSDMSVVSVDTNGNITATGRGEGRVICTVTDTDGNPTFYVYNITVSYTILQWIIIIVLFGWIWYV